MGIWGVIPAAGYGTRMSSEKPKQYLSLHGETILQRSCSSLLDHPDVDGVIVVLASDDSNFATLPTDLTSRMITAVGGTSRSESVASGVKKVIDRADEQTWALVHDAARPLLSARDLGNLISTVTQSSAPGGILATPVQDTLKRSTTDQRIDATVDRTTLWQAQTPQMFRASALLHALRYAEQSGVIVTDEASAMEQMGEQPLLVPATDPNFKITRDSDFDLANALLSSHHAPRA